MNAMPKSTALLLIALLLLGACAGGPTGSFKSATGETFSARSSPAKILPAGTKVDDPGLLKLGELAAEVPLKVCYERCRTLRETGNSTDELAREAAAKGADLVVLLEDNVRATNSIQKEDCARSEMGSAKETYIYYEDGFRKTGTRAVPVAQCTAYKTLYGKRHVLRSTGVIYRRGETKALDEQNRRQTIERYVAANDYSGFAAALKADPTLADVRIAHASGGFKYARSAVDLAVANDAFGALKALLEAGADPNGWRNDESSLPPVHRALHTHDYYRFKDAARSKAGLECLKLLLAHGADPNVYHDGFTPLHRTARYSDFEGAQLLLRHGADESHLADPPRMSGESINRGRTAYDIARWTLGVAERHRFRTVDLSRKVVQLLKR